ncbi:hypothetical protein [Gracilimonas sediminicola]|uniref:Uncharacterized protein n=1 Tax=Gracilimonas sediminicola TaxID=2952158 RepID=A0A9X2L0C6_9BACT|nr:hypothetical protein [Gracilimonas sediminicola]MCP9290011.1 hypothetical protein [Gracilimonas sediminicola]
MSKIQQAKQIIREILGDKAGPIIDQIDTKTQRVRISQKYYELKAEGVPKEERLDILHEEYGYTHETLKRYAYDYRKNAKDFSV